MAGHGASPKRKGGEGRKGGRAGGTAVGRRKGGRCAMGWLQEGDRSLLLLVLFVREEEGKKREKKKREKKRKEKNGKFSKPRNSRGEK
jgi:hypothetical protein